MTEYFARAHEYYIHHDIEILIKILISAVTFVGGVMLKYIYENLLGIPKRVLCCCDKEFSEKHDIYHGQYGLFHCYRTGEKGVYSFSINVKRSIVNQNPKIIWSNDQLFPIVNVESRLKRFGDFFHFDLGNIGGIGYFVFRGVGTKVVQDIRIGLQTGISIGTGMPYAGKVIMSRKELSEEQVRIIYQQSSSIYVTQEDLGVTLRSIEELIARGA